MLDDNFSVACVNWMLSSGELKYVRNANYFIKRIPHMFVFITRTYSIHYIVNTMHEFRNHLGLHRGDFNISSVRFFVQVTSFFFLNFIGLSKIIFSLGRYLIINEYNMFFFYLKLWMTDFAIWFNPIGQNTLFMP